MARPTIARVARPSVVKDMRAVLLVRSRASAACLSFNGISFSLLKLTEAPITSSIAGRQVLSIIAATLAFCSTVVASLAWRMTSPHSPARSLRNRSAIAAMSAACWGKSFSVATICSSKPWVASSPAFFAAALS